MALQVTEVEKTFKFTPKNGKPVVLEGHNPNFSPEEVLSFHAHAYPELTTATIAGPKMTDNGAEYEFKTTVGTKG